MSVIDEKERLRARARALRHAAGRALGGAAGQRLKTRFVDAMGDMGIGGETPAGRVVAGYWPVGDEVDLRPLLVHLHGAGFVCALPVVTAPGEPLDFRRWHPGATLRPAGFGLREPGEEAPEVIPDVVLAPLLAFDAEGYRLGHGAAYYDRTLEVLRGAGTVLAVGIGFAVQEVVQVPRSKHDQRLDWIVTEEGAVAAKAAGMGPS